MSVLTYHRPVQTHEKKKKGLLISHECEIVWRSRWFFGLVCVCYINDTDDVTWQWMHMLWDSEGVLQAGKPLPVHFVTPAWSPSPKDTTARDRSHVRVPESGLLTLALHCISTAHLLSLLMQVASFTNTPTHFSHRTVWPGHVPETGLSVATPQSGAFTLWFSFLPHASLGSLLTVPSVDLPTRPLTWESRLGSCSLTPSILFCP